MMYRYSHETPSSSSALCHLTVDEATLQSDVVLQYVLHCLSLIAPQRGSSSSSSSSDKSTATTTIGRRSQQCQVTIVNKNDNKTAATGYHLQVATVDQEPTLPALTQRCAVLRSLCGPALHYQLDTKFFALLGGMGSTNSSNRTSSSSGSSSSTSSSSSRNSSPRWAMQRGELVAWMSVADQWQQQSPNKTNDNFADSWERFLSRLDAHLSEQAFLLRHTSQPTLADLCVGAAIWRQLSQQQEQQQQSSLSLLLLLSINHFPHVSRWMMVVHATLARGVGTLVPCTLPAWTTSTTPTLCAPPVFYHGTEDIDAVLMPPSPPSPPLSAAAVKTTPSDSKQPPASSTVTAAPVKKKVPAPPKAATTTTTTTTSGGGDDEWNIGALELRVGQITKIWNHPTADKLYCEVIDFGHNETREIASGLRPFYDTPEQQLLHRKVVVLCNLKKRTLLGFASHGMVLCASQADHTHVECIVPPADAALGERVVFAGYEDCTPEPESKVAKKKIWEAVAPYLQTNAEGHVVWKGAVAKTTAGIVTGMAQAQVS